MSDALGLTNLEPGRLLKQAAPEIHAYMHSRIVAQFKNQGEGRGVNWAPFKSPWYTRSDGTSVPITGGVPWMNNKRKKVKAKLRSKNPEGKKRYTPNSKLLMSTGMLRSALLADIRISADKIELLTPVKYARYQDELRPFNFINNEEAGIISTLITKRLS